MSLLNVENLSHTFGDRTLFKDVSFRLLAEDHVGLVGANGVGKSTLMNIITGQLIHDSGRVEWTPGVHYGYLDQHTVLTPGRTMRDVLHDAFLPLFEKEKELNEVTAQMGDATPEELEVLLDKMGEIQDVLDAGGFYTLDMKIEESARGLGLDAIGLDRDVAALSGGQRTKVLLAKLLLEQPKVLLLDEPTNYLDVEHIRWLTSYLKEYPYAFILISKVERGDFLFPSYFEQEVKAAGITPIDDVWNAFPSMDQNQVRAALARCGLKNEHISRQMSQLSGGEQAKVRLCKLMMNESNWILFDEPTNHLDVTAKEELKRALKEYKGTVVLVCHEPDFYEGWITKVWNVEEWSQLTV